MKRVTAAVVAISVVFWNTMVVTAHAETPSLLIVGIQTGGLQNASQERIELANVSAQTIDVSAYRLEYYSANPKSLTTPARAIPLTGSVAPGAIFVLTAKGYEEATAQQVFAATLAAAGGHLRLSKVGQEIDFVGWGTAANPKGKAAPAPLPGATLQRQRNEAGAYSTTGSNVVDFGNADVSDVSNGTGSGNIILSELLPNPASPATDAEGEYIELYNEGDTTVDLTGCKLLVGPSLGKSFTFSNQTLKSGQYKAFYITETKLSLSNTASRVQLQAPDGSVLDEVQYESAEEGQTYAWDGAVWQWTTEVTPNAANSFVQQDGGVSVKEAKAATKKVATKKATTKKAQVKSASTGAKSTASKEKAEDMKPPLHTGVVAGVGGIAVLYGAYEYRQDVINFYRKLRGDRKAR